MDLAVLRVSLLHQVSHHSQSWGRDLIGTCKRDITFIAVTVLHKCSNEKLVQVY